MAGLPDLSFLRDEPRQAPSLKNRPVLTLDTSDECVRSANNRDHEQRTPNPIAVVSKLLELDNYMKGRITEAARQKFPNTILGAARCKAVINNIEDVVLQKLKRFKPLLDAEQQLLRKAIKHHALMVVWGLRFRATDISRRIWEEYDKRSFKLKINENPCTPCPPK